VATKGVLNYKTIYNDIQGPYSSYGFLLFYVYFFIRCNIVLKKLLSLLILQMRAYNTIFLGNIILWKYREQNKKSKKTQRTS